MAEPPAASNPQLRPVEAFPVQINDENMTCLRDPQGLAAQPIFLNRLQAVLVSWMDGTNTLRDIQAFFFRRFSELLPLEVLENLVRQLDEHHYLNSPAFRLHSQSLIREFKSGSTRPAGHAGTAYEGEAEALRRQIDGFFTGPGGPGPVSASSAASPLRGLIAPHIDFHRGGPTYAHAYKALAEHPGADRFIIFGTCHNPMEKRFALTEKDFETPLGLVATDRRFVRHLAARLPHDCFQDEFAHRGEHSIEFQVVCLKHVVRREFEIIPILVGTFQDLLTSERSAAQDAEITGMVAALRETIAELPGAYCVIAAADLAHVGKHFGDATGPTQLSLREVEQEDRKFLEHVVRGDAGAVLRFIAAERDRRRVCGYPPIYMALRCLENPCGRILDYRQWSDLASGAAVSFAGLALY